MRFLGVFLGLSALAALAAASGGEAPCRCGSGGRSGADTVDLGSLEWRFREAGTGDWLPAAVPGCVHTDLLHSGLIEEPFYRDNETRIQWVGERDWEYRAELSVTEELLGRDGVELDFEGLDTYADVFLNDSLLFRADNMFREWKAPDER